jgi:hypothetical protein
VTLPLLARPELGLPLVVQNACLAPLEKLKPKDREKWLVELRRLRFRAITDALEAAKLEGRARAPGWESSPPTITPEMIKMEIEALHRSMHNTSISPWERAIDRNAP